MPDSTERYNGWTNYETWNVALWIDNEEGSHLYRRELAREAWKAARADKFFTRNERALIRLAESLKDWIEGDNPLSGDNVRHSADTASLYTDLLNAALSEVNWREIAEHWLEDETCAQRGKDGAA